MQHLKAIRASAPLSTGGASPSLFPKHGTHPSQATDAHAFVGQTETFLGFIERAGRAVKCKSRLKAACAVTDRQQAARENERNRPDVASCTFVAMDPTKKFIRQQTRAVQSNVQLKALASQPNWYRDFGEGGLPIMRFRRGNAHRAPTTKVVIPPTVGQSLRDFFDHGQPRRIRCEPDS